MRDISHNFIACITKTESSVLIPSVFEASRYTVRKHEAEWDRVLSWVQEAVRSEVTRELVIEDLIISVVI